MNPKYIITGGGTGGHVFPALAIANEFRNRGAEVVYVGSSRGMESKLVPPRGFRFLAVKSGAVKNQSLVKIVKTLFGLFWGLVVSIRILKRERPVAVIGVGGYVSVPVVVAAFLLRIPVFLQEQNASVGIANRFLGRLAKKIFLGFEQAEDFFPRGRSIVSGNPLREEFFAPNFPPHQPTGAFLLVIGGSQGAQAINSAILELLTDIYENFPTIEILHQTGERDCDRVKRIYQSQFPGKATVVPFIDDMLAAYGKASLVIARSGALTCSELIQVQRPAIFVPFPRRGQNDQTANAYLLQSHGCARVVEQGDDFTIRFWSVFSDTFQPEQLAKMAQGFVALRRPSGVATIADHVQGAVVEDLRVPSN